MAEPEHVAEDRRAPTTDRRRYTRRAVNAGSPPYFEAFERMAVALESLVQLVDQRTVTLPDTAAPRPVRPRAASEDRRP